MSAEHEQDGIPKFSPSSLATYRKCPRKWAFRAVGKFVAPDTQAQIDGKIGHKYAEEFLKHGTIPDQTDPIGRLMIEGIPHLPKPGTAETETYFTREIDGITFHGYIDFRVRLPLLGGDHKFSSDPVRWGLTPKTMFEDEQVMIYGFEICEAAAAEDTEMRWVYYDKRKRRSFPVSIRLKRSEALAWIRKNAIPRAREMLCIRELLEHQIHESGNTEQARADACNQVQHEIQECDGVGRLCDHVAKCHLYPNKEQSKNMATFKERLAAKLAARAAQAGTPPEAAAALEATAAEVQGSPEPVTESVNAGPAPAAKKAGRPPKDKETASAPQTVHVNNGSVMPSGALGRLLSGETVTLTAVLTLK